MTGATASRIAALEILRAVRSGALASRALEQATANLAVRERAWVRELVYGTFRLRGRLDHRLAALSSRPLEKLHADVLDILRLGAYQLLDMGGVPAYAAVSQAVELAKRAAGRGAGGFVNGVLQSLRRAGASSTFPAFEIDPAGHLATWGSHPRWLVERWLASFGAPDARRLVDANNRRPELYLRALGPVEDAVSRLASCGVRVEAVPGASRALHVVDGDLAAVLDAPVIVQDPAAGLVVDYAAVPPGSRVVDLAAAPGGKAMAMAGDEPDVGPAFVAAADASAERLRRLRENVARLVRPAPQGLGGVPVSPVVADGRRPCFRAVDAVLLDAPCTGTGTLRRHPDGRWRIQPDDLRQLVVLQRQLLDGATGLVRPGGLLVYSTCSLEREENEEQVEAFLARHRDFRLDPGGAVGSPFLGADGTLSVLPQRNGWDGAFAARFRRDG